MSADDEVGTPCSEMMADLLENHLSGDSKSPSVSRSVMELYMKSGGTSQSSVELKDIQNALVDADCSQNSTIYQYPE